MGDIDGQNHGEYGLGRIMEMIGVPRSDDGHSRGVRS
jgi:hypothetical protein